MWYNDCMMIAYIFFMFYKFSKCFIIFIKQFLDDDNYFLFEGFNTRSWHFYYKHVFSMTNVIISMHGPKVHICMASLLFIPV